MGRCQSGESKFWVDLATAPPVNLSNIFMSVDNVANLKVE